MYPTRDASNTESKVCGTCANSVRHRKYGGVRLDMPIHDGSYLCAYSYQLAHLFIWIILKIVLSIEGRKYQLKARGWIRTFPEGIKTLGFDRFQIKLSAKACENALIFYHEKYCSSWRPYRRLLSAFAFSSHTCVRVSKVLIVTNQCPVVLLEENIISYFAILSSTFVSVASLPFISY